MRRQRASHRSSIWASLAVMELLALYRYLLFTEEEEQDGDIGSAIRAPSLDINLTDPVRQQYLDEISLSIVRRSRAARRARRRFLASNGVSIAAAGAVPVLVAMPAPSWIVGVAGGVAALVQGLQQLLQDGRISVEHHLVAVGLSSAKRLFLLDLVTEEEEVAFAKFAAEAEQVFATSRQAIERTLLTSLDQRPSGSPRPT